MARYPILQIDKLDIEKEETRKILQSGIDMLDAVYEEGKENNLFSIKLHLEKTLGEVKTT